MLTLNEKSFTDVEKATLTATIDSINAKIQNLIDSPPFIKEENLALINDERKKIIENLTPLKSNLDNTKVEWMADFISFYHEKQNIIVHMLGTDIQSELKTIWDSFSEDERFSFTKNNAKAGFYTTIIRDLNTQKSSLRDNFSTYMRGQFKQDFVFRTSISPVTSEDFYSVMLEGEGDDIEGIITLFEIEIGLGTVRINIKDSAPDDLDIDKLKDILINFFILK